MSTELEKHRDRALALDRALKMSCLFKMKHFDKVMKPVYEYANGSKPEPTAKQEFKDACGKNMGAAQLEDVEIEWLWNYLKNYKENLTDNAAKVAAAPGW